MSRLFGPMRQVGIVVRDIDKAMRHWVEVCGVGPWFYAEQLPMDEFRYRGRRYDIKVSIALANSGDVQLELIQQRCECPSLYRDFLAAGHEGMQHWSSWPANYHEIRERALATGWEIGQEGDTPRGPFIYFLNEGHPGTVVEMAEATPTRMRIFDQVREAALAWDGRDPIRMNWPQARADLRPVRSAQTQDLTRTNRRIRAEGSRPTPFPKRHAMKAFALVSVLVGALVAAAGHGFAQQQPAPGPDEQLATCSQMGTFCKSGCAGQYSGPFNRNCDYGCDKNRAECMATGFWKKYGTGQLLPKRKE